MQKRFLILALAVIFTGLASAQKVDDTSKYPAKKVLFFTKSAGYEHSVIRDPSKPYNPSPGSEVGGLAFQVLRSIAARENIEFVFSKDGSLFNKAYLDQFDAFFFFTTGVLTEVGTDGNPAMSQEGKEAFLAAVAGGKGFIGTHSATDTFHTPSYANGPTRPTRISR